MRRYDRHHTIQTRLYIHKFETMFHMVVRFLPYPRDDLVFRNSWGRLLRDTCYSLENQLTTLILMVTKESQQETGVRVGLKVDRQECDGGNGFVGTLIMNLIPCSLRQMVNMGKLWRKGHITMAHVWPILDSLAQKLHVGPPFPYFFIVHITRSVFPPVITTYKGRNCVNVRY